jgi:hypothetical protein
MIGGSPAEHAVVLWEHKTQLRHSASQAGSLFDQVNLQARVGKIERRPHTPNTAAYDQDCGWLDTVNPWVDHLHACLPMLGLFDDKKGYI